MYGLIGFKLRKKQQVQGMPLLLLLCVIWMVYRIAVLRIHHQCTHRRRRR